MIFSGGWEAKCGFSAYIPFPQIQEKRKRNFETIVLPLFPNPPHSTLMNYVNITKNKNLKEEKEMGLLFPNDLEIRLDTRKGAVYPSGIEKSAHRPEKPQKKCLLSIARTSCAEKCLSTL